MSRATIYRHFPGGRDELPHGAHRPGAGPLLRPERAEIEVARLRACLEPGAGRRPPAARRPHLLQKLLSDEPEAPAAPVHDRCRSWHLLRDYLAGRLAGERAARGDRPGARRPTTRPDGSVTWARTGAWDFDDPDEVRRLVRTQFLAGDRRRVTTSRIYAVDDETDLVLIVSFVAEPAAVDARCGTASAEEPNVGSRPRCGCIARWGVAKTTLDDIAREAGVSRATVYRAFPGGKDRAARRRPAARGRAASSTRSTPTWPARPTSSDLLDAGVGGGAARASPTTPRSRTLLRHEPEVILPLFAFDRLDPLLAVDRRAVPARTSARFLPDERDPAQPPSGCARLVLTYTIDPVPGVDLARPRRRRPARRHLRHPRPATRP